MTHLHGPRLRQEQGKVRAILDSVTWWQTTLVAVVPVLLTLVVTTSAEKRRRREDARERDRDREARAEAQEQARRDTARAAWRADKMQAHRDLLVFARRLWRCMVDAGGVIDSLKTIHTHDGQELTPEIREHLGRIHDAFRPLNDVSGQMDMLLTAVQMFCSEEARDAALRLEVANIQAMLTVHAVLHGNGCREVGDETFYARWPKDVVPITSFVMGEYASIVRRDLQPDAQV